MWIHQLSKSSFICHRAHQAPADTCGTAPLLQKQLDIELKASRAALHEAKEQGASAVAAAELEVKRAEGAAESKIDDYKDRVAKVHMTLVNALCACCFRSFIL